MCSCVPHDRTAQAHHRPYGDIVAVQSAAQPTLGAHIANPMRYVAKLIAMAQFGRCAQQGGVKVHARGVATHQCPRVLGAGKGVVGPTVTP